MSATAQRDNRSVRVAAHELGPAALAAHSARQPLHIVVQCAVTDMLWGGHGPAMGPRCLSSKAARLELFCLQQGRAAAAVAQETTVMSLAPPPAPSTPPNLAQACARFRAPDAMLQATAAPAQSPLSVTSSVEPSAPSDTLCSPEANGATVQSVRDATLVARHADCRVSTPGSAATPSFRCGGESHVEPSPVESTAVEGARVTSDCGCSSGFASPSAAAGPAHCSLSPRIATGELPRGRSRDDPDGLPSFALPRAASSSVALSLASVSPPPPEKQQQEQKQQEQKTKEEEGELCAQKSLLSPLRQVSVEQGNRPRATAAVVASRTPCGPVLTPQNTTTRAARQHKTAISRSARLSVDEKIHFALPGGQEGKERSPAAVSEQRTTGRGASRTARRPVRGNSRSPTPPPKPIFK